MLKNTAGQKVALFFMDVSTNLGKTGDAANLTAYVSIDNGAVTALTDTSATEMDATNARGWYLFDVSQAESNGNDLLFTGKSSTANVSCVGRPITTTALDATAIRSALGMASANMDTQLADIGNKTINLPTDPADQSLIIAATDAVMSRLGAPAGASMSADIAAVVALLGTPAGASLAADLLTLHNRLTSTRAGYLDNLGAALTESYRANGATGTLAQLLYELVAHAGEASISGTTKTTKRLDHTTTAETFTLNSATDPTSITRAS